MKTENNASSDNDIQPILNEIGKRLREKRKEKNKNYVRFAKEHGFPKMTVNRIENGENSNLKTIITFACAVNISLEELFSGM